MLMAPTSGDSPGASAASLGLADFAYVDMLGLRYQIFNFGAKGDAGPP